MIVCVSPGGGTTSTGATPATSLAVATIGGVYALERADASVPWRIERTTLEGEHISALLSVPDHGLLFAAAHTGGLSVSADGGITWTSAMNGIAPEHEHVFTLAAFPSSRGIVLWAGTQPAALYRSFDLGKTWSEVTGVRTSPGTEAWNFPAPPFIAHVKQIAVHPARPGTVFVCVEQGALLTSSDDGASWRELTSYLEPEDRWYRDMHRIVFAPSNPDELYLTSGEGLYHSLDSGASWTHVTTRHQRVGYPDAFFIDPDDERVLYMAGSGESPDAWVAGALASPRAGILRSADGGTSWTEMHGGLPDPITGNFEAMSLHAWPEHVSLFTGTAVGEVYESPDRGATWIRIASDLPPVSKVGHYKKFAGAVAH